MSRTSRRFGFTLVELLAVSGISTLLCAQILPAIQDAREAARRSQCKNNLKQIGLALLNYHDNYGGFPIGWVGVDLKAQQPAVRGMNGWGWSAPSLPYLDQIPLYDQIDFSARMDDEKNAKIIPKPLAMFRCPSDPFLKKTWTIKDEKDAPVIELATSNYVGSFGTEDLAICEKMKAGEVGKGNGMFFHNSFVKIAQVRDGTANTLAVGERVGDGKTDHLSTWAGVVAKGKHPFARILGSSNAALNAKERHPSDYRSAHKKGVHFLILDGSARFLADDIDQKLFQTITTRAGGEEVPSF